VSKFWYTDAAMDVNVKKMTRFVCRRSSTPAFNVFPSIRKRLF